jgi:hypothetical protein
LWSEKQVTNTVNVRKNVDLAPDAKRIVALLLTPTEGGGAQQQNHIVFLENFFDELRRRAPVKR